MGHKAAKTTHNNTFGPETANEHTVQKWFKNFCKWFKKFWSKIFAQMRSPVAGHQKLTINNGEQSLKLILLQLPKNLPKNSTLTIL